MCILKQLAHRARVPSPPYFQDGTGHRSFTGSSIFLNLGLDVFCMGTKWNPTHNKGLCPGTIMWILMAFLLVCRNCSETSGVEIGRSVIIFGYYAFSVAGLFWV